MSGGLPLPLRVLVKGASTVHSVRWSGDRPRTAFTFPRATEVAMYAAGVPAEVRATAMSAQGTKHALATWEDEIFSWSPDVVVLNYGRSESLPSRAFARRSRRVADHLVRLVERIQMVGSPLVLVMELAPPSASAGQQSPGLAARVTAMNAALADVVRRVDLPHVRLFPTNALLPPLTAAGDDGGPDAPEAHRAIGERLAEVIIEWAGEAGLVGTTDISVVGREIRAVPE
jgi:hypothetical protein